MGAFYLYKKKAVSDLKAVQDIFTEKGFTKKHTTDFGIYTLWLFQKISIDEQNFIETKNVSVYVTGTPVYKSLNYSNTLKKIKEIIEDENFQDLNNLYGNFCALAKTKNKYYLFTDKAGIQNVYHDINKQFISSSFLAVIASIPAALHINKLAATEILVTGNLIGPDSLIQEINRFSIDDPVTFDDIQLQNLPKKQIGFPVYKSRKEALENQLFLLKEYFLGVKNFCDEYGVSSGLTGGLDSRLLLILIDKYVTKFQFYTSFRKKKGQEILCAEKVCDVAGYDLICRTVTPPLEMTPEKAWDTLEKNYYYIDGHIRANQLWTEEVNIPHYRRDLLADKRIGMSGVGGEQYRNHIRMWFKKWNFRRWVKYDLVLKSSGDQFLSRQGTEELVDYLLFKISKYLKLDTTGSIDHLGVKRYYNEIYNPSNRTVRNNIENQLAFFLSPYTEFHLARQAYGIIPYLGLSSEFEGEMIKQLHPIIAAIMTDYGFDLNKGEPLISKLVTIEKDLLPKPVFNKIYHFKKRENRFLNNYMTNFEFSQKLFKNVTNLELPLNLSATLINSYQGTLIMEMGYFLEKLKNKISL